MNGSVNFRREGQARLWRVVLVGLCFLATWALWASDLSFMWAAVVGIAVALWSLTAARDTLVPHTLLIERGVLCVRWSDGSGAGVESVRGLGPLRVLTAGRRHVAVFLASWPETERRLFSLACRDLARAHVANV